MALKHKPNTYISNLNSLALNLKSVDEIEICEFNAEKWASVASVVGLVAWISQKNEKSIHIEIENKYY